MKTRTKLKYTVIAMIIETFLLVIKQPVYFYLAKIASLDEGLATTIIIYYEYLYKWARVACYAFFVFFILQLEKEYKHKVFGHFFIADFCVCVVDAALLQLLMYAPELATDVRHYTEVGIALATAFTSFFAGTFLYSKIRSSSFRKIRTAYRLYALRYFIYALILTVELIRHNVYGVGYMAMGAVTWWVFLIWFLRMPLLLVSRFYLLRGVLDMKTAKEQHEEHKAAGKTHHHHHHHRHKAVEDDMQTCDS